MCRVMFCAVSNGDVISALMLLSLHVIALSVSPSVSDNTWSVGYSVQRGRCGKPFIDNGQSRLKNRGRVLRYKCRPGYQLYGDRVNTCVAQHWVFPHSICVKGGCSAAPAISNGSVSVGLMGALRTYSCDDGYTLQGHAVMYCNGRHWNGTAPLCQAAASHSGPSTWCDFETAAICGWTHDPSADFQWTRHSGLTPSSDMNTGPATDHTLGLQGHYMYLESSAPRIENDTARLFSAVYTAEQARDSCFQYWFHMYGLTQGELRIYFLPTSQSMDGLTPARRVFGNRGNQWNRDVIPVPSMTSSFQIVIEGVRGSGFTGDCAIDDVSLLHGDACIATAAALPPLITQSAGQDVSGSCLNRCDDEENVDHPCSCTTYCQLDDTCCRDHVTLCTVKRPGTASTEVLHQLANTSQTVTPHSPDNKPPDLRSMNTSRRIDHSNGDHVPSTTSASIELTAAERSSSRPAEIAGELPSYSREHRADQQAQIDQRHSAISVAVSTASSAATDATDSAPPVDGMSAVTGANPTLPLAGFSAVTDATGLTTPASTLVYRSKTSAEDTYFDSTSPSSSSDSVGRQTSVELTTPATPSKITPVKLITPSTSSRTISVESVTPGISSKFKSDSTFITLTTPGIWPGVLARSKPLVPYTNSATDSHRAMMESSTSKTGFITTNEPKVQVSTTNADVDATAATFPRISEVVPIPTDDTPSHDVLQYIKQNTSDSQNNSLKLQDPYLYSDYRPISLEEPRVSKFVTGESTDALNEEDKMWPGAQQSSGHRQSVASALAAGVAVAVVAVLAVSALVMFLLRARRQRADQLEDCDSLMFFADSNQEGSMDLRVRIRSPSTPGRPAPRTPSVPAQPETLTSNSLESEPIHDVDLEAIDFDESETARLTFN